jgi:hypothetical protein
MGECQTRMWPRRRSRQTHGSPLQEWPLRNSLTRSFDRCSCNVRVCYTDLSRPSRSNRPHRADTHHRKLRRPSSPRSSATPQPPAPPGHRDIALILARIARGLHRARALEERLVRNAARLDAPPKPPRSSFPLTSRPIPPPALYRDRSNLHPADLPTSEQIAAEGAPPTDRRRYRRHLPRFRHPSEPSPVAGGQQTRRPAWRQPCHPAARHHQPRGPRCFSGLGQRHSRIGIFPMPAAHRRRSAELSGLTRGLPPGLHHHPGAIAERSAGN